MSWLVLATLLWTWWSDIEVAAPRPTWSAERPPERIVAASVFSAEVLLEIVPRERIVGVSVVAADARWCLVADKAQGLPVVGQSPEELLAARPDLVITDPFTERQTQEVLESVGVAVLRTAEAADYEGIAANIRLLGEVTRCEKAAEALILKMDERLAALDRRQEAVAGWRLMTVNGSLDTYGAGSLFDAAVRAAGAEHVPAAAGMGPYQTIDEETLLAWRPDGLVVADVAYEQSTVPGWLLARKGVALLPALRLGRVVRLPSALLASTSHHAVGVAEALQEQLAGWSR
jgi:iron complex transport system substrate-binding protein